MTTLKSCVICNGSVQCLRCENFELKAEIRSLKRQIAKYNMEKEDIFQITKSIEINNYTKVIRYIHPLTIFTLPNDESIINWRFLTLTFDPMKFGIEPNEDDRKNYILHHLLKAVKIQFISTFYGCFEYHESGIIHSHIVIKTTYADKFIEDYFQPLFTDNRRNKKAVVCLPAKKSVLDYIHKVNSPEKRSNHFFRYKDLTSSYEGDVVLGPRKISNFSAQEKAEAIRECEFSQKEQILNLSTKRNVAKDTGINPLDAGI